MGDSYRALESLLPLLKTQVWGKAGKDGAEGVCGGQSMGSLEHPFNFYLRKTAALVQVSVWPEGSISLP